MGLQASELVDEGFMISIDYGADADALIWHLGLLGFKFFGGIQVKMLMAGRINVAFSSHLLTLRNRQLLFCVLLKTPKSTIFYSILFL